eukprot:scaffold2255_cov259-Pinguiococcus_pyrenoidosus.AAC.3
MPASGCGEDVGPHEEAVHPLRSDHIPVGYSLCSNSSYLLRRDEHATDELINPLNDFRLLLVIGQTRRCGGASAAFIQSFLRQLRHDLLNGSHHVAHAPGVRAALRQEVERGIETARKVSRHLLVLRRLVIFHKRPEGLRNAHVGERPTPKLRSRGSSRTYLKHREDPRVRASDLPAGVFEPQVCDGPMDGRVVPGHVVLRQMAEEVNRTESRHRL